ncbi:MAG: PorV/PorQ family protein [Ignavibacteria bacterium]|nr:PorV/PorQ family protein [Ignavibacteria bacterium]
MKKYIYLIIVLAAMQSVFAQSKIGTTAANFLTIPVGPKATGMGGAFAATGSDASAIYWNPGAISRIDKNEFTASFSEWLVGTHFNWFGLVYKLSDNDAIGLSLNQLDYGEEDVTTVENPNGTGDRWDAQDICLGLTYAKNLTDRFSVGATVKYIRQQIYHMSASAFAMDIGLLFHTQLKGLSIGMNIANFGTDMQLEGKDTKVIVDIDHKASSGHNENISGSLDTDTWPLPLVFTVGLGYEVIKNENWQISTDVDAVYPNNQSSYLNVGGELVWNDMFAVRAGWNSLFKEDAEEGFCGGVGLKYDFGGYFTKVDYSYNTMKRFDAISKISVTIGF